MVKMIQNKTKSAVTIKVVQDSLEVEIFGNVTGRILDTILKEMDFQSNQGSLGAATNLVIDLSKVVTIKPSGAVSLVSLCSAIMTKKIEKLIAPKNIFLRYPPKHVIDYLVRIGFFTHMSLNANLMGHGDLVDREEQRKERDKKERADGVFLESLKRGDIPIILPMRTIGSKDSQYERREYEYACYSLLNNVADHFKALLPSYMGFGSSEIHDFLASNYEIYKNVYEHSNSWGLIMIHARPRYGTYFCCYDVGMGIRQSVNSSEKVSCKFDTDYNAIMWALIEGHSSKNGGNGLGLNIVEDFVSDLQGIIEIRSGNCLLQKKLGRWKPYSVTWFPGTQINVFIPYCGTRVEAANAN